MSTKYIKGALLLALVAFVTANALPTEESTANPAMVMPDATAANKDIADDVPTTTVAPADNNTTTETTPSTTSSTTPATTPTTSSSTTTPATTTPTTSTTPTTTSTTTTAKPTTSTPAPSTTSTETPTTPAPTPVPHCKRFDAYSFVGGMILAYGSLAISLVLYKFYKTQWSANNSANPNYRTL